MTTNPPEGPNDAAVADAGREQPSIPYRFPETVPAREITERFSSLGPGEGSGVRVAVAGRVMLARPQGKVAFFELRDWTGQIQLFARAASTEEFDRLVRLSLGDWIGATGEVVRTRRGELSVAVERFELLARAERGFGDKWHGMADVELRHRQREVDLWANEGVRDLFLARSRIVASLRRTLEARGFVEVETPVLQPLAGGANARPFVTHYNALHADFFLRIAPELYLKRLVVGGFERVYEMGKDFRNEGLSPRHNPEFTMLEAYQAYGDYLDMAELIESLVANAATDVVGSTRLSVSGREVDLSPPWRRATMDEVILEVTGTELHEKMGLEELRRRADALGVDASGLESPGEVCYEVYERLVEHELWGPVHVMDYPIEVSPLTREHRSRPGLVERLTPVITGREIAEAYSELVDPAEQRRRFSAQAHRREAGDEEAMEVDEDFLRALEHGMPPTGGIGLGVDRLTMVLTDRSNIREVLLFPALRPLGGSGADRRDEDGATEDGAPEDGASGATG